jgi:hypothetical protein
MLLEWSFIGGAFRQIGVGCQGIVAFFNLAVDIAAKRVANTTKYVVH